MEKGPYIPTGVWIFHGTWATAAAIAIVAYLLRNSPNKYDYIQTLVLTLTLVSLAIYTGYTRQMQKAMVHQTTVNILPVFEVEIVLEGELLPDCEIPGGRAPQSIMTLKNVGNGTALNIQVESVWVFTGTASNYLPMKFERLFSLAVREQTSVKDTQPYDVATARYEGERRADLFALLVRRKAWSDSELKIWFSDILGNKYVQIVNLGRAGVWSDAVQADDGNVTRTKIIFNSKEW